MSKSTILVASGSDNTTIRNNTINRSGGSAMS